MTAMEVHRETGISIYVVYHELAYEIDRMRGYFSAFDSLWSACLSLVDYRYYGPRPIFESTGPPIPIPQQKGTPELVVQRMRINSPLEITFVVQGGGGLVGAYAAFLFVRALRAPESIGSWLPQLVEGWHRGWRNVKREKRRTGRGVSAADELPLPGQVREVRELMDASRELIKLGMDADEVEAVGLEDAAAHIGDPNAL